MEANQFNALRISLASPDQIRSWAYGEVTKPETINYRTLKPEKDGLFCEKIFGPTKDYECYCGKYKKIRYKGIICDRCGVEVARSKVRRERMGRVELAAPVSHIWYVKGTPSRIGLLLGLSPRTLERVLYFAQHIITSVNEDEKNKRIEHVQKAIQQEINRREIETRKKQDELMNSIEESLSSANSKDNETDSEAATKRFVIEEEINKLQQKFQEEKVRLEEQIKQQIGDLESIQQKELLTESRYRELKLNYGDIFEACMGAEAVLTLLQQIDIDKKHQELQQEINSSSGQKRKKAIKVLRVVEAFRKSGNKPEWMVLTVLPVLPPDLRPMVQLDGGRFATSDLNDLYRRVINRNNRLRRLMELGAPDIIIKNEKRMLQEAVDSLIDNGRRGRAITGAGGRKLKSLSDMLRGKQGRFRQNLLGKRVDYSGRSVIIVGPELKLHQCGLPRRMALELYKPFIMSRLVRLGIAANIKSARRMVDRAKPEVWDILEDVIKDRPVLLNRAPTLHRLSIQAFEPVLIDGSAIQIHPLVCTAFNADFDGDQMAVHLPLSRAAVKEARYAMLSTKNMLAPSSGQPIIGPTLDIVLGCYYATTIEEKKIKELPKFLNNESALLDHEFGKVRLREPIQVKDGEGWRETSIGRILFNEILPEELKYKYEVVDKYSLKEIINECIKLGSNEKAAEVADNIKTLGFRYATVSGTTIAADDIKVPTDKAAILGESENQIKEIDSQYQQGLITEEERYSHHVQVWISANDRIKNSIQKSLDRYGGVYMMATSGAKGNIAQISQMAGMRGLMTDPSGRIIDFPIRSSFREGLSVLEYFISTHGARKGLADTALRTSDSGYLTRRLIDVSQGCIILNEDCGTRIGIKMPLYPPHELLAPLKERIAGRFTVNRIVHTVSGEIMVEANDMITEEKAREIEEAFIERAREIDGAKNIDSVEKERLKEALSVTIRSPLTCRAERGLCQKCYGRDLGKGKLVDFGVAVGIIAAQSIGEPGTQLTMRTFHTGGVVGLDITSGLPRVEELFEARNPKGAAIQSDIAGTVDVINDEYGLRIKVVHKDEYLGGYRIPPDYQLQVSNGNEVEVGQILAQPAVEGQKDASGKSSSSLMLPIKASIGGKIVIEGDRLSVRYVEQQEKEYEAGKDFSPTARILVKSGNTVRAGDPLTDGPKNPQKILQILGREAVQRYLVNEVQKVYRSQGVNINDKHVEVIVRQMLRKVGVESPGDTELIPGEFIDRFDFEERNKATIAAGGEPATAQSVLLGITRASLSVESFLAAASFQETTRVLTDAAVWGRIDKLLGLKENVIIGRLIPARCLSDEEYRAIKGEQKQLEAATPVLGGAVL